jgi:hypothetical protein
MGSDDYLAHHWVGDLLQLFAQAQQGAKAACDGEMREWSVIRAASISGRLSQNAF